MDYLDSELEDDIDENLSEEDFIAGIEHLNKCFFELDKSDFSNQDIKNLIEQFDELQNKVIETKNDSEYRTKELRELFKNFINFCDGRGHISNIIKLSADEITDEENFDKDLQEGFVYLIRNQDIYKIGITENLLNRMSQLEPDEIIDTIKCSNFREVEKDLHREYKDYRIPQTEYFRLTEKQVLEVSRKLKSMAK